MGGILEEVLVAEHLKLYFRHDQIGSWLLVIAVAIIYIPFLNNPLVFDDTPFFNGTMLDFGDMPFDFHPRWFPYTTLGVTGVIFGKNLFVFRIQNVLLHVVNALLLLLLLRLWITIFVSENVSANAAKLGAWIGALFFACHPLAVYGVGYLIQRSILMATFFTLLMYLAYFRGLLAGNWRYMVLALAAYFLAVYSKEHSVTAPIFLLLMTMVLRKRIQLSKWPLLLTWCGFFIIAISIAFAMKGVVGGAYEPDAGILLDEQNLKGVGLHWLSVVTQSSLFFKYLLLMLIPNPAWMSIDMRESFAMTMGEWQGSIGLLAFVMYGALSVFFLSRGGRLALLGIALLYPWCFFFTEFSTVRVQEIFVLYRTYLWLPGLMLLFPVFAGWLSGRSTKFLAVLLMLILIPASWNRLWVMADDYRLWNDAVILLNGKEPPGAARIYYGRGHAAEARQDWEGALTDYKHALSMNSAYPEIGLAVVGVYVKSGRLDEGGKECDRVIREHPNSAKAHYYKAVILHRQGKKLEAKRYLENSCSLGNNDACIIVNLTGAS